MTELFKPFARWASFNDCKTEQMQIGHSEASAKAICGFIQARAEKGQLFKMAPDLEILKAVGDDLVVGGHASWELVDPENDFITTEAMVHFLSKFFKLAPEYRAITIDHSNFRIGTALLQYPDVDPRYFSHVHEKGMYLIAKIRNDALLHTQEYRKKILDRIYKMFSISGKPIRSERIQVDGRTIRKVYDIDPTEVAIVKEGMNPMADFDIIKTDLQKPDDQRPPQDWWDACMAHVEGGDPAAVCGHIFYHVLGGDRSRADPSMFRKGKVDLGDILLKMTWDECIEQARKNPDVTDPEKLCAWLGWHGPNAPFQSNPPGKKGIPPTLQEKLNELNLKLNKIQGE
jgi:hypothetical protein